jgi:NADPH:quinone reductase-like Zn-dependent oxidoreductase
MQAAVPDRYGSVDDVELRDVEKPTPTGDQVLVRVRAASINRAGLDALGPRPNFARLFIGLRAPRNNRLGIDIEGVVEAVGPDASRLLRYVDEGRASGKVVITN